jgi:hypothetical protein
MEKNDINLSVEGEGADKKGKRDSNIINPRGIKKGSSLSKGQGSLRQKKADVSITNN